MKHSERDLLRLAAGLESRSEHPLGRAVVRAQKTASDLPMPDVENFRSLPDSGIIANIKERHLRAGSPAAMSEAGFAGTEALRRAYKDAAGPGSTADFAVDGQATGFMIFADDLRSSAPLTIASLRRLGIEPVLLTGDSKDASEDAARKTGITECRSVCRPETKLQWVKERRAAGIPVLMIGNGINDPPALRAAHVGIAMGAAGTDIAADAADTVLSKDDLSGLPHIAAISLRMMTSIRLSLTFSMVFNFLAIALTMTGIFNPVTGAPVHNADSLFVVICAALLLNWKSKTV